MKRSREEVDSRREALATMLRDQGYLPVKELCARLNVSEPTLRRDLSELAKASKITRTHGGALVDYNLRFPSFQQRRVVQAEAKRRIAQQALPYIQNNSVLYLDAGTTIYEVAQQIRDSDISKLTIVTSSLPISETLAGVAGIEVFLTGGRLLERQSILIGQISERSIQQFRYDWALMSAEGLNDTGLWNTTADVVRQQKSVLKNSENVMFCLDQSKQGQQAEYFLCRWNRRFHLNTDV
ncbi:MAG: DeoR/GlpR family DNA-binding transcription regulator [Verrucomicrobiota bacterium]